MEIFIVIFIAVWMCTASVLAYLWLKREKRLLKQEITLENNGSVDNMQQGGFQASDSFKMLDNSKISDNIKTKDVSKITVSAHKKGTDNVPNNSTANSLTAINDTNNLLTNDFAKNVPNNNAANNVSSNNDTNSLTTNNSTNNFATSKGANNLTTHNGADNVATNNGTDKVIDAARSRAQKAKRQQ